MTEIMDTYIPDDCVLERSHIRTDDVAQIVEKRTAAATSFPVEDGARNALRSTKIFTLQLFLDIELAAYREVSVL
jgi:uncharacterized 2Fe-2S/4Fe-4S cluster protein (DUF4445 family)